MKLKVLFAGSGAFGVPTLQALHERHDVVHVYTQPDKPAGRGKRTAATSVADWAESAGLPLVKTDRLNAEPLPAADVLVVIAFGQKISQAVTQHPRYGAVNLHASLLPAYRGAAPIHAALINGETVVGNSVIRLAERMDAGAILGQGELAVRETETTGELHDRLANAGPELVLKVLAGLAAGTAIEREQAHDQATLATKLSREDAAIDFARSGTALAAQINGLSPWPGVQVRVLDADGNEADRLTLLRARPAAGASAAPGSLDSDGLIFTGDGRLELLDVKPQGKRAMALREYRNGKRWEPGLRLISAV